MFEHFEWTIVRCLQWFLHFIISNKNMCAVSLVITHMCVVLELCVNWRWLPFHLTHTGLKSSNITSWIITRVAVVVEINQVNIM